MNCPAPAPAPDHELLQEGLDEPAARRLQDKWRARLHREETLRASPRYEANDEIRTVGGVDVSYPPVPDPTWGVASCVVWDCQAREVVETGTARGPVRFPYVPGFLGFRECPLMARAILRLQHIPDVVACDGHGRIHPRRFGEACQLGVVLDLPTFGVAKSPFVGTSAWTDLSRVKGATTPVCDGREVLGLAVVGRDESRPVFVSVGSRITLDCALAVTLTTTRTHRQPDPLFLADQASRRAVAAHAPGQES